MPKEDEDDEEDEEFPFDISKFIEDPSKFFVDPNKLLDPNNFGLYLKKSFKKF